MTKEPSRQAKEIADFVGALPDRIYPTSFRILERNGHLLLVKHYQHNEVPSSAHRRIFRMLVAYGNSPDAPGSVSVLMLWAVAKSRKQPVQLERQMQVWDWTGEQPKTEATDDAIKAAISRWWSGAGG